MTADKATGNNHYTAQNNLKRLHINMLVFCYLQNQLIALASHKLTISSRIRAVLHSYGLTDFPRVVYISRLSRNKVKAINKLNFNTLFYEEISHYIRQISKGAESLSPYDLSPLQQLFSRQQSFTK